MARTLTTATRTALQHDDRYDGASKNPCAVIVLVSPMDALEQCSGAITNAIRAGAVTLECVVDPGAILDAVENISTTVDYAAIAHPHLPVVLVGHDNAEAVTLLASEALQDAITGVVVTRTDDHPRTEEHVA